MARRCGALLPSGKRCARFVRPDRNSCEACLCRMEIDRLGDYAQREAAASRKMLPPSAEEVALVQRAVAEGRVPRRKIRVRFRSWLS